MHGLIFKTSIWLLAGSTRLVQSLKRFWPCFWMLLEKRITQELSLHKTYFVVRERSSRKIVCKLVSSRLQALQLLHPFLEKHSRQHCIEISREPTIRGMLTYNAMCSDSFLTLQSILFQRIVALAANPWRRKHFSFRVFRFFLSRRYSLQISKNSKAIHFLINARAYLQYETDLHINWRALKQVDFIAIIYCCSLL